LLTSETAVASHTVYERVSQQADRTPNAVAVTFQGEALTYRELNARANQIARGLRAHGVGPGTPVGICLDRSLILPVAVLAILKAGGAYVPLDPAYPAERLGYMLANAGAPLILTQSNHAGHFSGSNARAILLDNKEADFAEESAADLTGGTTPDGLCYIIYTSGSTGRPKGVAMPHRALANLVAWQVRESFSPSARTLQFASLSFDVSFQEIFSTWCGGGTLVIAPQSARQDPGALLRLLADQRIERLFLPFVALLQLAEEFAHRKGRGEEAAIPLREVVTAGEQLKITPAIVTLFEALPRCTLHNHYGPSETHVATAYTLRGEPRDWPVLPPIGKPLPGVIARVLDENGNPVATGAAGDLYLGGLCLADGYINRQELTAERFIKDPFTDEPNARLYRTGDRARLNGDGDLEFLGRADDQIKIRGYRVEPGEVEQALLSHPAVRQAVVAAREIDDAPEKELIGYVVLREMQDAPPSGHELRQFVAWTLPEYLVPSHIVFLDAIPLTPSGKEDRRALPPPEPIRARPELDTAYTAPSGEIEEAIARFWEEILHIAPVGANDNVFDLGAQSLHVIQMHRRLSELLPSGGPDIALLFQYPAIRALARQLKPGAEAPFHSGVGTVPVSANSPGRRIEDRVRQQKEALNRLRARR
jgi:amino acid adenylation domain-containing protein